MPRLPTSNDEPGRLAALERYSLRLEPDGPLDGFQSITDLVADLLGASICSISIVTDELQYFAAITGGKAGPIPRSQAICSLTALQSDVLVISDLTLDERFASAPFVAGGWQFRSYAGVPLVTPDGYGLGALCVIDRKPRHFSPQELRLLSRFGEVVVEQLELRTLAHNDFLTGALSRRAFTERASAVLRRAEGGSEPASLVVLDVDHFKQVNDRYGHGCGDKVLRAVVKAISNCLRPGDLIGRLGGEEFAVLLPDCDGAEAGTCAERFRKAVALMQNDGLPMVTASFGVASSRGIDDFDSWLMQADAALYVAKNDGRNRTIIATELAKAA